MRFILSVTVFLSIASGVRADAWLQSSPSSGRTHVRWAIGEGFSAAPGERAPHPQRLLVRTEDVADLSSRATDGSDLASLDADPRGTLVSAQSVGVTERLSAAAADDLFDELGLDQARRMRMASGAGAALRGARVRTVHCDKLWIGGTQSPHGRASEAAGLPLEIVPTRSPSDVTRLKLDVLFHGRPLAGALVRAWRQPRLESDAIASVRPFEVLPFLRSRTNGRGRIVLDVAPSGSYLVSASHALPSRDRLEADWELWDASLAFTRGAADQGAPWTREPLRGTGLGTNPDLGNPGFSWPTTLRDRPGWGRRP